MATKILVIGSNSFSGGSFVDFALEQGCEVTGISRSPLPLSCFPPFARPDSSPHFRFCKLDLNHDLDAIMELIHEFKPPIVVNFAAQSMVGESWQHPEHWFQTNVMATVALHERLRKFEGLQRYVHVSTPEVYGSCSGNIREDAPYNPSTPYAVSRAAADMSLLSYFRNYRFPVVFTRAANVFGPGQQLYRLIPRTILFIRLGRKLPLHGGGHSVRSFIHIRDVSDGTMRVATRATPPSIFHLSTERQISIRGCVELICRRMGVPFQDAVEVTEDRPGKDAAYLLDSAAAKQHLGWSPAITLEDGIDQTISWIDANLPELRKQPFDYIHKP